MGSLNALPEFKNGFSISDLQRTVAENDDLLAQYYVGKDRYVIRAINRDDQASVFVGPKGVGKSAILQMVRLEQDGAGNSDRVIEIAPDDLAFNALTNVDSTTGLLSAPGQSQFLYTALWDYVLSVEILSREAKDRSSLASLLRSMFGSKHEREQKKLLALTLNDDGTTASMTDRIVSLISAVELSVEQGGTSVAAKVSSNAANKTNQLTLLQLVANVAKNLKGSLRHEYYILIDDLDLHWNNSRLQNEFLGAMFLSIRKLSRSRNIKFVVSLRETIYQKVEFEERDKFSPLVCRVSWDKDSVLEMLERRIEFVMNISQHQIRTDLFSEGAYDYMWSVTDGMPRELLRIATVCIEEAIKNGSTSVTKDDLRSGAESFSRNRRDDLASQYLHIFPQMAVVLKQFSGGKKEFDMEYLREVAFKVAEITERSPGESNLAWACGGVDDPLCLARSLVTSGFLLTKDGRSASPYIATEEDLLLLNESNWYAIHPMYSLGLGLEGA